MKIFLFTVLLTAVFISCKNDQPDHDNSVVPLKSAMAVSAPAPASMPVAAGMNAQSAGSVSPQQIQMQTPAAVAPNTSMAAPAGKMNPAHGQPGHKCEIPVGAPLNSAPPKPVAQNATAQTVSAIPAPQPQQLASGKGLNPAHGQPGHRCDISVGAPLNSPVQKASAQGTAIPTQMAAPTAKAVAVPSAQTGGSTAGSNARLNPAHGQPGHDCKIPVGQPLK